jgi:uncharacterized caspase-like protein
MMRKALVVGINNYRTPYELHGCESDVHNIGAVLEVHSDGSPNFAVKKLTDVLFKSDLLAYIEDLFSTETEISLLYFSGHGLSSNMDTSLVTPDFTGKGDDGLISMDSLLKIVNASKAREKIVILDCCHAGKLGNIGPTSYAPDAKLSNGTTILASCKDTETSSEDSTGGVFTNLLVLALQGGAATLIGDITPGGIYAYIDQALGPWDQRPVFKTNVSQFTSLRKVTSDISLSILRELPDIFPEPEYKFPVDKTYEFTEEKLAMPEHVEVFEKLKKLTYVHLVKPNNADSPYWAAMNSKTLSLTALGAHYWKLAKNKRI